MLKIIGRITVILCVCGLIAGGIYLLVQHNSSALGTGNAAIGRDEETQGLHGLQNGAPPVRSHDGEHGLDGDVSPERGFLGIVRNLIVFSVITLLVAAIQKLASQPGKKRAMHAQ